ncbi:hypothetical protein LCGC14_0883540 [marine sediment metagenome]|uniref:Uncharacterized protein n=1 Tax=marine sediment metagenome TaxID=412755 RepID=A0A0F9P172_9ZZZZ
MNPLEIDSKWLDKLMIGTLKDINIKVVSNGYYLSVDCMLPSYGSDRKDFVFHAKEDLFDALKKILSGAMSSP